MSLKLQRLCDHRSRPPGGHFFSGRGFPVDLNGLHAQSIGERVKGLRRRDVEEGDLASTPTLQPFNMPRVTPSPCGVAYRRDGASDSADARLNCATVRWWYARAPVTQIGGRSPSAKRVVRGLDPLGMPRRPFPVPQTLGSMIGLITAQRRPLCRFRKPLTFHTYIPVTDIYVADHVSPRLP